MWRRDWEGVFRFPAARIGRLVLLAVAAGLCVRATWAGTTPLVIVAGLALFVAATDAFEPLAQQVDQADLSSALPVDTGSLLVRHLASGTIVMLVVTLIAAAAGVLVDPSSTAVAIAAVMVVPAALTAASGGVASVVMGAPAPAPEGNQLLPPEVAGMKIVLRAVWPILLTLIGLAPIIVARVANDHNSGPVAAAAAVGCIGVLAAWATALWVRYREALHRGWHNLLEQTAAQSSAREGGGVMTERRRPRARGAAPGPKPSGPPPVLATYGLEKSYGEAAALLPLDLRVRRGEALVLVGHNGSGKTTLLRMLAGLLDASDGSAEINGHAVGTLEARAATSFLSDTPTFYDDLSVWEHLEYTARLHGVDDWEQRAADLLGHVGLYERADDLPTRFSRGLRQKAAITLALIRPFEVLLVDEPFVGLDATGKVALLELLDAVHRDGAALLVATHELDFVNRVDRCIALRDGRVVHDGGTAGLDVLALVS